MAFTSSSLGSSEATNTVTLKGLFTGGGAGADWVKVRGAQQGVRSVDDSGNGFTSVAYNAATGKFLLTFREVGTAIAYCNGVVHRAAGSSPLIVSFDIANLDLGAKTIPLEVWNLDETADAAVLTDPALTAYISLEVCWFR